MLRWRNLKKEAKIILSLIIVLGILVLAFTISFFVINWRSSEKFQITTSSTTISSQLNANKSINGILLKILNLYSGGEVKCLATLPDGTLAVGTSAYSSTNIQIWNIETSLLIRYLFGHTNWVRCLKVMSDGTLASGSDDRTIKIWNPQNGELLRTLRGHTSWVIALEKLSDGSLASGDSYNVKIWNASSGQLLNTIQISNTIDQFILLRSDNLAISYRYVANIDILDLKTSLVVRRLNCSNNRMSLTNEGNLAAGGTNLTIWDVNSGERLRVILTSETILYLQLLSDGNLASGLQNGDIQIWNPRNGQLLKSFDAHPYISYYISNNMCMCILNDGSLVSSDSGTIKIWK